jgi:DNA mismatch repair ATPase MutS
MRAQDGFTYTYLVGPGRADRSYGIQVARMAGTMCTMRNRVHCIAFVLRLTHRHP